MGAVTRSRWPMVRLAELLTPVSRPEPVDPEKTYRLLGTHWYVGGLYVKDVKTGAQVQAKTLYRVEEGDFVYNRLFAWKGSFALTEKEHHGCYVSNEFPCFTIRWNRLDGRYLLKYFSRPSVWEEALGLSTGGTPTSRNRLKEDKLLGMRIPLPPLEEQQRVVALVSKVEILRAMHESVGAEIAGLIISIFEEALGDETMGGERNSP